MIWVWAWAWVCLGWKLLLSNLLLSNPQISLRNSSPSRAFLNSLLQMYRSSNLINNLLLSNSLQPSNNHQFSSSHLSKHLASKTPLSKHLISNSHHSSHQPSSNRHSSHPSNQCSQPSHQTRTTSLNQRETKAWRKTKKKWTQRESPTRIKLFFNFRMRFLSWASTE